MSNDYFLTWKVQRGYYNLGPSFEWLSDEECDYWEDLKRQHARELFAAIPKTEGGWARLMGLAPPQPKSKIDKDEVKARVDMVALMDKYGVALRVHNRRGMGKCPFHQDRGPSFSVDLDKKVWYCFGCAEGSDVFGFIMKVEEVSFPEALKIVSQF